MRIAETVLSVLALSSTAANAQQTVDAVRVASRVVERKITLPAEFASYLAVDLRARVNGFVDKVYVDRGSAVKEGQQLVILVAPELAAQVIEAESKVQAAEAQQSEARAKLVADQSTYDRLKAASATPGAVAENELVAARQAVDADRSLVQSLESTVRGAGAAAQSLKDLQSYLKVTAPFDGIVTARFVHPGALVGPAAGPGAALLRVEQNSRLRLVAALPEANAGAIVSGGRVPFTVQAFPGETFWGVIARISHSLDVRTRTMPVELDVANPKLRLAPGMYAQVEWPVRSALASLLVPPASIVTTNERQFVIRISGGVAEWVDVKRGAPAGDLVEVFGPLRPGDLIVRRATDELRQGTRIQAHEPTL